MDGMHDGEFGMINEGMIRHDVEFGEEGSVLERYGE